MPSYNKMILCKRETVLNTDKCVKNVFRLDQKAIEHKPLISPCLSQQDLDGDI